MYYNKVSTLYAKSNLKYQTPKPYASENFLRYYLVLHCENYIVSTKEHSFFKSSNFIPKTHYEILQILLCSVEMVTG